MTPAKRKFIHFPLENSDGPELSGEIIRTLENNFFEVNLTKADSRVPDGRCICWRTPEGNMLGRPMMDSTKDPETKKKLEEALQGPLRKWLEELTKEDNT
ncbi:MAG: hypothetical protein ACYCYO_02710 [Bacilli bacterium]